MQTPWIRFISLLMLTATVARAGGFDTAPERHQFREKSWTTESGLPQDTVLALIQSLDGYIWIGTGEGLVRYDGVKFTVFDRLAAPALPSESINAMIQDPNGAIWIGTRRGLAVYRDGILGGPGEYPGLAEARITALATDGGGQVWVGTRTGLFRLDGGRLVQYGTESGLPHPYVYALTADTGGTIWVGTLGHEVARFTGERFETIPMPEDRVNAISALAPGDDESMWVGTIGGGLFHVLHDGSRKRFTQVDGLPSDDVMALHGDRSGKGLWVGTWGGLCRIRKDRVEMVGRPDGVGSARIATMLEDHEGSLWVGTHGSGLRRLNRVNVTSLTETDGLPDGAITGVLEDRKRNLWIGTAESGLVHRWPGGMRVLTQLDGLRDNAILAMAEAQDGTIWVGTATGLTTIHGDSIHRIRPIDGLTPPVWSLAFAPDGALWVGHFGGTGRLTDGRFEEVTTSHTESARALLPEPSGQIWVGTGGNGVFRYEPGGRLTRYGREEGLPGDGVYALFRTDDGTLWVGSDEGLAVFRDGQLTSLARVRGLQTGTIRRILEDRSGYMWLSTTRGIFRVSREELEQVERRGRGEVKTMLFGIAEGMPSAECDDGFPPTGEQSHDGRLWFPTLKGLASIDPGHLVFNTIPPPIRINDVIVDGAPVEKRPGLTLPPDRRNFEFHYTALSFLAPERVQFRYRLNGYDDGWIDAGSRRTAYYMNLPAGHYTFEVTAANNDGLWSQTPGKFTFDLSPHFYMRIWFYLAVMTLLGAATYVLHQRNQHAVQREFSVILAERSRMAREIHDTLAQGLAGISIQLEAAAETLTILPEDAKEHIDRARGLARTSLAEARRSVSDLRSQTRESGDLLDFLSQAVTNLAWGSSVQTIVESKGATRPLPQDVEENLLRIGEEAARNALRHAGATQVRVTLEFNAWVVRLRVADDGHGFDVSAVSEGPTERFGLIGMRERAEQIEGEIQILSTIGLGSEIVVTVPVR